MLNFKMLMKMMAGSDSLQKVFALTEAFGLQINRFKILEDDEKKEAFQSLAKLAVLPGANLMIMSGRSKDGENIEMLAVFSPGIPRPAGSGEPEQITKVPLLSTAVENSV